jgi:hypothetical protein
MNSVAKMKSQLTELEEQRTKLGIEMGTTGNRFKLALAGTLVGAVLSVLYGLGFILLIAGVVTALIYGVQQAKNRDKMEEIESEIHKLSAWMV